jgi:hypothetical protein
MRWIKRIRVNKEGVSLAADVNAAVAINEAESGETQTVRSVSHTRVVQDSRPEAPVSAGDREQSPHPASPASTGVADESDADKEEQT